MFLDTSAALHFVSVGLPPSYLHFQCFTRCSLPSFSTNGGCPRQWLPCEFDCFEHVQESIAYPASTSHCALLLTDGRIGRICMYMYVYIGRMDFCFFDRRNTVSLTAICNHKCTVYVAYVAPSHLFTIICLKAILYKNNIMYTYMYM